MKRVTTAVLFASTSDTQGGTVRIPWSGGPSLRSRHPHYSRYAVPVTTFTDDVISSI